MAGYTTCTQDPERFGENDFVYMLQDLSENRTVSPEHYENFTKAIEAFKAVGIVIDVGIRFEHPW